MDSSLFSCWPARSWTNKTIHTTVFRKQANELYGRVANIRQRSRSTGTQPYPAYTKYGTTLAKSAGCNHHISQAKERNSKHHQTIVDIHAKGQIQRSTIVRNIRNHAFEIRATKHGCKWLQHFREDRHRLTKRSRAFPIEKRVSQFASSGQFFSNLLAGWLE